MESIFKWISELSLTQGMGLLCLAALVMFLIPYGRFITAFVRHIIYKKPLVIESFQYHFFSKDTGAEIANITEVHPDYLVNGSVLMLSWQVSGAWRVDLEPIGRDLKGNAASVIFTGDCLQFTLKAYGFFRPPETSVLQIPVSSAYVLVKKDISSISIASAPLPAVNTLSFTRAIATSLLITRSVFTSLSLTASRLLNRTLVPSSARLLPEELVAGGKRQKALYRYLDKTRIMRTYTFSTKKYPNTLH